MKTQTQLIIEEMSITELVNAREIVQKLLQIISEMCTRTKQRRFACDLYIELLLANDLIQQELIWRKGLE